MQADPNPAKEESPPQGAPAKKRKQPSDGVLLALSFLVGFLVLAAGVGWMIYDKIVNAEVETFAIPLIMTVPVIAAVAFRSLWD